MYVVEDGVEIFVAGKVAFRRVYGDIHWRNANAARREKIDARPTRDM
jgi:hypothetical protein